MTDERRSAALRATDERRSAALRATDDAAGDARFLLRRDRAVQAGAGTGKTHALVTQYLHLCAGLTAHGQPILPQHIAALTFTDKAAGEMVERLRQRVQGLLRAAADPPLYGPPVEVIEPALHGSAQLLGRPLPGRLHWEQVLIQLGAAPVGTFHSFAGALLRRHPDLGGVDPDFALLDEETARELEREAAERVVLQALEGQLADVSAAEAAAVVAEYGFVGAGDSSALVELLCQVRRRRAEEGQPPDPDALCQGYRPAGVAAALALSSAALWGGLQVLAQLSANPETLGPRSGETARALVRRAQLIGARAGTDPTPLAAALPEWAALVAELGGVRARPGDDETRAALAAAKQQIKGALAALEAVANTGLGAPLAETLARLLLHVWHGYAEAKRRVSALDFTDLLYRARDLLRDHAPARARVQERFQAILVDEFQDTNPLQSELLELLAGPPAARSEAPAGRLYIVGDRKQSIYEFRGADVGTFAGWCHAIAAAGGDSQTLRVSRRSLPGVLMLANALFAQVMQPPQALPGVGAGPGGLSAAPGWLVTWDEERDALIPLRAAALPDQDEDEDAPAAELLVPEQTPEVAALLSTDPLAVEAGLVARRLRALHDEGRRYGDMAVLLRRFTHLDRYVQALRQQAIPHYVVKGRGFYDAQEIRDLTAALALLDDPEDTLALVSVLRAPLCGLSDDSLVRLHLRGRLRLLALLKTEAAGELPELDLPPDEGQRLRRALQVLRLLLYRGDRLGPAGCLRALCDATDVRAVLAGLLDGEQRVANLDQLLQRAQRHEEAGGGLRGFVRWLRQLVDPSLLGQGDPQAPQAQIVDERDDVVRVMTVHQAKGLEFPVVVVPGCAARERFDSPAISYDRDVGLGVSLRRAGERLETLPWQLSQRVRRQRQEAESARLFYVAVTRARDRVIFAGEGRASSRAPGRASSNTWRGWLEALRASPRGHLLAEWRPPAAAPAQSMDGAPLRCALPMDGAPLRCALPMESAAEAPDPVRGSAMDSALLQAQTRAAALSILRAYRPAAQPVGAPPSPVELSLSAACDLAVCGRRHHLRHGLSLREYVGPDELPARAGASDEEDSDSTPEERLRRGTLAHRLLQRVDLGGTSRGDEAELAGLLLADGLDPALPEVGEVRTRALRLLRQREVAALLAERPGRELRRAVPFTLPVPGGVLRGVFDLLVQDPDRLTALDYHYGYAPALPGPLQDLRRALLSAALRGVAGPGPDPGVHVRVGFVYLREAHPAPQFQPVTAEQEEAALAAVAAGLPGALLSARDGLRAAPLPRERCAALQCGYRYRCHGERVQAQRGEDPPETPPPDRPDGPELMPAPLLDGDGAGAQGEEHAFLE